MLMKIFFIGKAIREAKNDPSGFASSQTKETIWAIFIIPIIILALGLVFLFILSFTHMLGGPYLFFKIIFFIGLFFSSVFFVIVYELISKIGNTTKKVVSKTINNVGNSIKNNPF